MKNIRIVVITLIIINSFQIYAQNFSYHKAWEKVELLQKKGLTNKALVEADIILQQSVKDGASIQKIKSLIYKSNNRQAFAEDANRKTIEEIKWALGKSEGVEQAMLLVALSDAYLQYYHQNQWLIRQRKGVIGQQSETISQWSQRQFQQEISGLINKALSYEKELKAVASQNWKEVFISNKNGFAYQPFLYDFVAWKAIEFYSSDEFSDQALDDLILLNNPAYFDGYSSFILVKFNAFNKLANKEKPLFIFQKLAKFHQGRKDLRPLLLEESTRMDYLLQHGAINDKSQKIQLELASLFHDNKGQDGSEMIARQLVDIYINAGTKTESSLKMATNICRVMIEANLDKKYFTAVNNRINQKEVSIDVKAAMIPLQASMAQIRFKNIDHAWFKIVRMGKSDNEQLHRNKQNKIDFNKYISLPEATHFDMVLSKRSFLLEKSAIFQIPELDNGFYAIIASSGSGFDLQHDVLTMGFFTLTKIQLLRQTNSGDFILVNRENGKPISGADVYVFSSQWEYNTRRRVKSLVATKQSDKNGRFSVDIKKGSHKVSLEIAKGNDQWISNDIYVYRSNSKKKSVEKHYFFTDRAIYRPGQKVYFKAILTEQIENSVKPLANQKTEVFLYSTQGKKIQSLVLTSNEYGSVSGSFTCPLSGLNGRMRIADSKGNTYIRMEAYKRPNFEVSLDSPQVEYSLNDTINIEGMASYFAGVGVQNAQVKYRIMRSVFMPWRWTCWPVNQQETPISAGLMKTNIDGRFTVSFPAIAPHTPKDVSWYHYIIITEVTDAGGETHTQRLQLNVGNRSLYISANLPEILDVSNVRDVLVKTQTANEKKVPTKITFRLEKLLTPKNILQDLVWEGDTLLISQPDILRNFKHFSTRDEINEYEVDAVVLEKTMYTKIDSVIPKSILRNLSNGAYKLTLTAHDKNGKEVKETAFTTVFSSKSKKMPFRKDSFFHMDRQTVLVGDTARFSFGSSFQSVHFYYQISRGDQIIKSSWEKLNHELLYFEIPILEQDRGGINVQLFFEKNNHMYTFNRTVNVPFENKQLQIKLISFRNPMQTGQKESWSLRVSNNSGHAPKAEILAGMYDASLDVFAHNKWSFSPYHSHSSPYQWKSGDGYFHAYKNKSPTYFIQPVVTPKLRYVWVNAFGENNFIIRGARAAQPADKLVDTYDADLEMANKKEADLAPKQDMDTVAKKPEQAMLSPRKNFQETAFFYPQLVTDENGSAQLNFTSPEALSRWKLMVLATGKNMEIGSLTQEFVTQKELMVMPNLPRFLRGGDHISLSGRIVNLLDEAQSLTAELEILDAKTREPINILAPREQTKKAKVVQAKGQVLVQWTIDVPEDVGAVIIRMLAKGDRHSDGEEHLLPVLSQLHFLTDTYPFVLSANNSMNSQDLGMEDKEYNVNDELSLEITTNPLWYVVQALPNYQLPQTPAALSWLNYYYIHSLAVHIVAQNPQIETVFKQWQLDDSDELQSELSQNPKLKQILLQETPWVQNAERQTTRRHEIARLFQQNNLSYHLDLAVRKMKGLQKSNGGFAWYEGMPASTFITAQILQAIGELKNDHIINFKKSYQVRGLVKNAVKYLDGELMKKYSEETLSAQKGHHSFGNQQILLARAYFLTKFKPDEKQLIAYKYYLNKWVRDWQKLDLRAQINLAQTAFLFDMKDQAEAILLSLKDKAIKEVQGGIYWRDLVGNSAPENQAAMVELFQMAGEDQAWIDGMKVWLLQQKRANDWGSGMATAKACYAMLSGTTAWNKPTEVFLTIDGHTNKLNGNAGTGYVRFSWRGKEIAKKVAGIKIRKQGEALVFGAFYQQHFEKMNKVNMHEGGVDVEKKVFVAETKNAKNELLEVKQSSKIYLGDRILIRLSIKNRQAMDFVHLRDYLPSGFENQNTLSGYHWQGGIGFYRSSSDVATDFFIYHLPKGEFVIEYELNASLSGILNVGPAEMQSLYAPEFGGHSEGSTITVLKNLAK